MKYVIKYLLQNKWIFRSIFKTVIFNFHYLPFKQAVKLPIFVYKLNNVKMGGGSRDTIFDLFKTWYD